VIIFNLLLDAKGYNYVIILLGFTPLMYACETGNDECALALIQAGAKVMTTVSSN
jgi:ankyrin repeat protein